MTTQTDPKRAALMAALESGQHRRAACAIAGIGHSAFYASLSTDDQFRADVEEAEAKFAARMLDTIDAAARKGSWRAALAALERRVDGWQRRDRLEIETDPQPSVPDDPSIRHSEIEKLVALAGQRRARGERPPEQLH